MILPCTLPTKGAKAPPLLTESPTTHPSHWMRQRRRKQMDGGLGLRRSERPAVEEEAAVGVLDGKGIAELAVTSPETGL